MLRWKHSEKCGLCDAKRKDSAALRRINRLVFVTETVVFSCR